MSTVALIGAGLSGLTCADKLRDAGHTVAVYDKGRTPAGRMSSRTLAAEDGRRFAFDFGAQFFTARDRGFRDTVREWASAGLAGRWPAAGDDAWVGTPAMDAPLQAMAAKLAVHSGIEIERIEYRESGWGLTRAGSPAATFPRFDALAVAIPAEQAASLTQSAAPALADIAARTPSQPCWSLMIAFDERLPVTSDTIDHAGLIGWAARDGAKPGRAGDETWVVHAAHGWSAEHLDRPGEEIAADLLAAFAEAAGIERPTPVIVRAHCWKLSKSGSAKQRTLWDAERRIGLCGDWLGGPRVENAWLAGSRLADAMLESLPAPSA